MTISNIATVVASHRSAFIFRSRTPLMLAAAILLGAAHAASAQPPIDVTPVAAQPARWEFRVSSGAMVPTGVQRETIKNAPLTIAQLSYLVRPLFAVTGSFGWARSHDLATAASPKLDVFTYDLGGEARAPQWRAGRAVTFNPFAGAGIGGRSYNYRKLDVDATRNVSAYAAVGGEVGLRRVHVRLEVRDYVGGFKPLAGGGQGDTRNDIVMMVGLRIGTR